MGLRIAHVVQRYIPAPLTGSERYIDAMTKYLVATNHYVDVITSLAVDWPSLGSIKGRKRMLSGLSVLNRLNVKRLIIHYEIKMMCKILHKLSKVSPLEFPATLKHYFELMLLGPQIPEVIRELGRGNYDVINVTPYPFSYNWYVYIASKKTKTPLVLTPFFHYHLKEYYNPFLISILREADAVIAFTENEANLLKRLGARRIHISAMGLWVSEWLDVKDDGVRDELGLDEDYFTIIIPHPSPLKGSCQVLMASILLRKQGIKVATISFGQLTNAEYEKYAKIAKKCGVRVIDLGYIDEEYKKKLLASANVLAQPSISDAYGLVYLEAWVMGKPVIAARTKTMENIVKDNVDGFLVRFNDYKGLANKLLMLARNPDIAVEMGKKGREKVLKNNDWGVIGKRLENLYKEIIEERGTSNEGTVFSHTNA